MTAKNKCLLIILDGWGLAPDHEGNAPFLAKTPTLRYVYSAYPKTSLTASGLEVGLNPGEPGNSEVGHMNIGLGRVVWENLPRIDKEISSGGFFENEELLEVMEHVRKHDSSLHLLGLVSDGGVHSHLRHLISILEFAAKKKVKNVFVHFISDGRDTAPQKAIEFVNQLQAGFDYFKIGKIATVIGRYFAMDRDNNWDRETKALDLFINNVGDRYGTAAEAFEQNYKKGKTDEFVQPSVIGEGARVSSKDAVIFFNHRSDRMRQMVALFAGAHKSSTKIPANIKLLTMTRYEDGQKVPAIFLPISVNNTLSEVISKHKLTQFHTAETEKYAHVTYFFSAGREKPFPMEKDKIVPSKKVSSYAKLPEMSAEAVRVQVVEAIKKKFDFIVVNLANGDMVGHTGSLDAAKKACEFLDIQLKEILGAASLGNYRVLITADHGNCEMMIDQKTKTPNTEHTSNPVPFVFLNFERVPFAPENARPFSDDEYDQYSAGTPIGVLADIAPSILANLGVEKPPEMSGMDLTVAML